MVKPEITQQKENLPTVRAPHSGQVRLRWEEKRILREHLTERFRLQTETETELMRIAAQEALDKREIEQEVRVALHRVQANEWLAVEKLDAAARAKILTFQKAKDLVNLVGSLNLDPLMQGILITHLYDIFFPNGLSPKGNDHE